MYHVDEENNRIYVNLYNTSEFEYNGVKIIQETDYPRSGEVKITVENDKEIEVYFRIPDWNKKHSCDIIYDIYNRGYIKTTLKPGLNNFTLDFDMPVAELYANPKVHYAAGSVAVKRGPIVYCAEGSDNGENLKSVKISKNPNYQCEQAKIEGNDIIKITCDAEIVAETSADVLYSETPFKSEKKCLELIPYAAWANRGRSEMLVWLGKE